MKKTISLFFLIAGIVVYFYKFQQWPILEKLTKNMNQFTPDSIINERKNIEGIRSTINIEHEIIIDNFHYTITHVVLHKKPDYSNEKTIYDFSAIGYFSYNKDSIKSVETIDITYVDTSEKYSNYEKKPINHLIFYVDRFDIDSLVSDITTNHFRLSAFRACNLYCGIHYNDYYKKLTQEEQIREAKKQLTLLFKIYKV